MHRPAKRESEVKILTDIITKLKNKQKYDKLSSAVVVEEKYTPRTVKEEKEKINELRQQFELMKHYPKQPEPVIPKEIQTMIQEEVQARLETRKWRDCLSLLEQTTQPERDLD